MRRIDHAGGYWSSYTSIGRQWFLGQVLVMGGMICRSARMGGHRPCLRCVVVWKLDRLSRSLKDVLHIMERIGDAGAGFRSITEAVYTTTPAGRMMMRARKPRCNTIHIVRLPPRAARRAGGPLRSDRGRGWAPIAARMPREGSTGSGVRRLRGTGSGDLRGE